MKAWVYISVVSDFLCLGLGLFAGCAAWNMRFRKRLRRSIASIKEEMKSLFHHDDGMDARKFMAMHIRNARTRQSSLEIYNQLLACFEKDRPYLDPNLCEADVARLLGTNRSYVSKALRLHAFCTFPVFVSNFRVNYSLKILQTNPSLRVNDVAYMCGFNSSTAFTRAFRDYVGVTPGKWAKDCRDKIPARGANPK